ncbi:MAG: hypothetical protein EBS61_10280 [Betaproteobacteria bacterium]|jgi:hypothetical protein|nr:hypothetical protein [Betaproteobacteria bacterium]NDD14025.1 hypothetical protein [Betaproteobacteria bacterium]
MSHDAFDTESGGLAKDLQDELLVHARLLADFGPIPGRPTVDTLKGSRYANMMELRFCWQRGGGAGGLCIRSPAQGRGTRNETDLT